MGWWFGRILTFEIEADETTPTVGLVLNDASGSSISSDNSETVLGFAAYGSSVQDAIAPLVENYCVELFDDGTVLRGPASVAALSVDEADLGNSADDRPGARIEREQSPAQSVPSALRLTYYDPDRDYQTGEARAVAGEQSGREAQMQLPAVVSASAAKSLAQTRLARMWAARDTLTMRLPPRFLDLEPGSRLSLSANPLLWRVDKVTNDGFVIVAELRPVSDPMVSIAADPGRVVASPDVKLTGFTMALIDVPSLTGSATNDPTVLLAATSAASGWRRSPVELSIGGQIIVTQTAPFKSVLGHAVNALAESSSELIDEASSLDVQLVDSDQWLTSCDDDGLFAGMNLAALGGELLQFARATPLGAGRFRLSRFLRGRGGTEWACTGHTGGEVFCMLSSASLQALTVPRSGIGASLPALTDTAECSITFGGENVRPLSPVSLNGETSLAGDLALSWTRRSRVGFAWVDGIDAPLGEATEQYRVVISNGAASAEYQSHEPSLTIGAADLAGFGSGEIIVAVQQVGDFAASRPTTFAIAI